MLRSLSISSVDRGTDSVVPRFVDVFWETGNNYGSNGKVLESSARRSFCGRFMGIFYESGRFFPMV